MNNPTKTEPLIDELLGGNRLGELRDLIARSKGAAEEMLSHGAFVREEFNQGNINSSPAGSTEGALAAASAFVHHMHPASTDSQPQPFFGQNIRELWSGLRPFFRRG